MEGLGEGVVWVRLGPEGLGSHGGHGWEVRRGWRGDVKGPFNAVDREKAGLTPAFYENLKGEMHKGEVLGKEPQADVAVGYEGAAT